jgi:hypothetical protein
MGRLIRHENFCRFCLALPVSPLMASMISSSFRTLLMTEVGSSPLFPASFGGTDRSSSAARGHSGGKSKTKRRNLVRRKISDGE